jgi:hypothetical protein
MLLARAGLGGALYEDGQHSTPKQFAHLLAPAAHKVALR